ncbi:hypothetical protein CCR75_006681 [Bremia lactucae]|uniref:Uncharacterized protein n=1 Tax=Bremia lactucae TaxID=4779 RepID=A0A976NZ91_BRELC|nr:hypothetical protein CCR75_006681 [Bremia lactucae]
MVICVLCGNDVAKLADALGKADANVDSSKIAESVCMVWFERWEIVWSDDLVNDIFKHLEIDAVDFDEILTSPALRILYFIADTLQLERMKSLSGAALEQMEDAYLAQLN